MHARQVYGPRNLHHVTLVASRRTPAPPHPREIHARQAYGPRNLHHVTLAAGRPAAG